MLPMPSLIRGSGMAETVTVGASPRARGGLWSDAAQRLMRNRVAMVGVVFISLFVGAAILAPWIAPYPPNGGSLVDSMQPPSLAHIMGTDIQGRDEYSRILYGARVSLMVGFGSVIVAVCLGSLIGAIAGAVGGRVDSALMRVVDVFLAIPGILLAIGIVAFLDRGLIQITLAVAIANAPIFARLQRGSLLAVRESDYVVAARSVGVPFNRILLRHMLRNSLTPIIVAATLALGTAIIDVAGLGFLGLGPPDPRTAEWGTMLQDSTKFLRSAQYLIFFPGLAIMISVIGFNLFGDGLREAIDPRLKK
jgi:peptide/nickel transport system permease protein